MADNREKKHWVFRVGVADRAGALTSWHLPLRGGRRKALPPRRRPRR